MDKKLLLHAFILSFILVITLHPVISQNQKDQNSSNNPKPASASVYNLGLKSYEQGDTESAINYFKSAIDLDPEFVDAYYNLGAIYKKEKDYYKATSAFQKAVDINPGDLEAVFELASCYMEIKNYVTAKKYFSQISNDFPSYKEALANIEKADRYLAVNENSTGQQETIVKSDDVQAQLLTDTLTKAEEQKSNIETTQGYEQANDQSPVVSQPPTIAENQGQLLANALTKPTKETFKTPLRIVTGNFQGPTGIAKDSKNNTYIANFMKDTIDIITPDGHREVFVEKRGISGPVGLAIDNQDNLYIANFNGNSIVKVTPNKEISILVNNIVKPYYLLYDQGSKKLFSTVQGNDALVEIDIEHASKHPITLN